MICALPAGTLRIGRGEEDDVPDGPAFGCKGADMVEKVDSKVICSVPGGKVVSRRCSIILA